MHNLIQIPYRAVDEARTRDPGLGKPMLYQLSYYRGFISQANLYHFHHLCKYYRNFFDINRNYQRLTLFP